MYMQNPAKAKVTRKFIVAEAIYYNWGDMAPLPQLVGSKHTSSHTPHLML